jgi:hypothetical protein
VPTSPTTPAQPPPLQDLHPEQLSASLTPDIVALMRENAGSMIVPPCSGWVIRDGTGTPVGILTAKHCGLLPSEGNLSTGSDGQPQVTFSQPVDVYVGDHFGTPATTAMTVVGTVTSFYVDPTSTDDVAVGIFSGQDPMSVVALAQSELMPADQVAALPEGTVAFEAGFPEYQPRNTGPLAREDFAMSVLGPDVWTVVDLSGNVTEQLSVLVAAVPLSPDGSECSQGNSGSALFVVGPEGQPELIGVASAFTDWGDFYNADDPIAAQGVLSEFETKFDVALGGYAAVCGFNDQMPTPNLGAELVAVDVPPA